MNQEEDENSLNYDKSAPMVPFLQMFKFSSLKVKIYLGIGIISSIGAGFCMPLFIIFIGDLYDSFDPDTSKKKVYGKLLQ